MPDAGGRDVQAVARRIASRAARYIGEEAAEDRETGLAIACKLLTAADATPPRVQLEQRSRDGLVGRIANLKLSDRDANGCPKPAGGG